MLACDVPIYMEISRLYRTVTIVARGLIGPDEIRTAAQELSEANVRSFAKVIEVTGASTAWTPDQVGKVAAMFGGQGNTASSETRGPIAFIVDPIRNKFAQAYADQTHGEVPIKWFQSLHQARDWLKQIEHERANQTPLNQTPWSDPDREGLMIRGDRQREVRIKALDAV
jgi:hypothetical protein